jgi:hypothetical protein
MEIEPFGVTMAKPWWSHAQGIGRKQKYSKEAKLLRSQEAPCTARRAYHQLLVILCFTTVFGLLADTT